MTTYQQARLTVEVDVDGDATKEIGVFDFEGDLRVDTGIRTGYLLDGRGGTVNSVVSESVGDGTSKRKGVYLDLGSGVHYATVEFRGWEGSPGRWGNGEDGRGDSNVTESDAEGAGPLSQIDVLKQYLLVGEVDSRNPATLEYGEFSTNGVYDPLDVVFEQPTFRRSADDGSFFDGSITFLEAVDLTGASLSASGRPEY